MILLDNSKNNIIEHNVLIIHDKVFIKILSNFKRTFVTIKNVKCYVFNLNFNTNKMYFENSERSPRKCVSHIMDIIMLFLDTQI